MRYSLPAAARNWTGRLVAAANGIRLASVSPEYTAINGVKPPATTDTSAFPDVGVIHRHQTDRPPVLPAWSGSPSSFVAKADWLVTVSEEPFKGNALAKASLSGGAESARLKVKIPDSGPAATA